jgi:hypothetical protein
MKLLGPLQLLLQGESANNLSFYETNCIVSTGLKRLLFTQIWIVLFRL